VFFSSVLGDADLVGRRLGVIGLRVAGPRLLVTCKVLSPDTFRTRISAI